MIIFTCCQSGCAKCIQSATINVLSQVQIVRSLIQSEMHKSEINLMSFSKDVLINKQILQF